MNLDQRARLAAAGINASVAEAELRLPMPGSTSPTPVSRTLAWAGAAMIAVLLGFMFIQLAPPTQVADDVIPPERNPIIEEGPPPTEQTTTTVEATTTSTTIAVEPTPVPTTPPTTVDTVAPFIDVRSPAPGSSLDDEFVRFSGTTEPGAVVTAGRYEAEVADNGEWSIVLRLSPGPNRATFTATDAAGNSASAEIVVTYVVVVDDPAPPPTEPPTTEPKDEPPPTTEPEPEPEPVEFSVTQHFGECDSAPPFDVFSGTSEPGSTITVSSPYGSGSTVTDSGGHFELLVEFPSAPYGETFSVTVGNGASSKTFSFVSWAG